MKHIIECPDEGIDRNECPCEKCAEYRKALAEFQRDQEDEDWRRREPSRRYDRDQWCRINGRVY
jgi:hypothetical protein